jgi:hypothetical protein
MAIPTMTAFGVAAWLMAGTLLGAGAFALGRKLRDWREARLAAEWDPY